MAFTTTPRDRVVVEHSQIDTILTLTNARIDALDKLLSAPHPSFISDDQWVLLQDQFCLMEYSSVALRDYKAILEKRLNAW